jgi:hypothetical protein
MTATFLKPTLIEEIKESIASSSGRYVNPSKVEGTIRFRFFGAGITGYEGWIETEDGKSRPVRWETLPNDEDLPATIRAGLDGKPQIKRFVAGVVYEYKLDKDGDVIEDEGQFKIINITQKSIMDQLFRSIADKDYGDPSGYDFKLSRTGEKLKTEYKLVAAPPKAVSKALAAQWEKEEGSINLAAFMSGEDPFKNEEA